MVQITFLNCVHFKEYMEKDALQDFLNTIFLGVNLVSVYSDDIVTIRSDLSSNFFTEKELQFIKTLLGANNYYIEVIFLSED